MLFAHHKKLVELEKRLKTREENSFTEQS